LVVPTNRTTIQDSRSVRPIQKEEGKAERYIIVGSRKIGLSLISPFIDGHVALSKLGEEFVGPIEHCPPKGCDTGIEIVNHDFVDVLVDQQTQSDSGSAGKGLDISAGRRRLAVN
jgi:hypothetical protein